MWSSWFLCRAPSKRFLVDSSASTMHAYFVMRSSGVRQVSLYFLPLILQGIAAGIGTSNFLRAIFHSFNELRIFWINEVNTAQSSSVFKLRFVFPFVALLLTCLSISLATSSQAWISFVFSWTASWTSIPIRRFFVQYGESCESGPRIWYVSVSFDIPIIVYTAFKHHIQGRTCCSGHVNVS